MSFRTSSALLALMAAPVILTAQDITPLATARQQAFGTKVTKISGRVTAGASLFRNTAFLQDASAGIAVFNRTFREGVRVGDSVIIENANLTEFGQTSGQPGTGLTQLAGDSIRFTVVPGERREPSARTVAIPRVSGPSGEEYEGQLVRLRNVRFVQQGLFQGETTYQIVDNFGNDVDVRLDGGTEIAINNLPIPTGDIDLIGVVGQFRGNYQLQPRFSTDVGLPPLEKDTVSRGNTLDVTTWNLEWLGYPDSTRGPADKNRQFRSIRQVMDSIRADMYGVQEVLTAEALSRVADSLAGSYSSVFAADVPSDQKMGWIYNRDVVTPVSTGLAVCGAGDAWAGGRFPFRMTFDTKVGSETVRMVAFVIHAKASTDTLNPMNDYTRRKNDGEVFYNYLTEFYKDSNVIIIGDFNDDMTTSVIDSTLVTPWTSFTEDKTNFSVLTLPLSERGLVSYVGFNRAFLDHIVVSNEVVPLVHRTYIEAPQAYMSSYGSTVSDHLPVTVRIRTNGTVSSVDEESIGNASTMRLAPNPMSSGGIVELSLHAPAHVRADVVDMMGRTLFTITDEHAAASTRILPIDASQMSPGTYMLRVAIDGVVATERFVVTR
jgi:endonuclease/exonuclease/phosphatase family metal-dependent hydrolase